MSVFGLSPDLSSGLWGSNKDWSVRVVGGEVRTNSNTFSSLKLCHILSKYKWIHVISIFLLLIKKKKHPEQGPGDTQAGSCHCRNDFNTPLQKGSALPSFLSWTSSLVWPWTAESSWPCISSGSYEPLFRSPVMLHSVIQSPFTPFLCLPLYMNFSVLSAVTPRPCLYLSTQQCQETFARLDLSCLPCLIVSAGSAPGCGWKQLGLSLTVQE